MNIIPFPRHVFPAQHVIGWTLTDVQRYTARLGWRKYRTYYDDTLRIVRLERTG